MGSRVLYEARLGRNPKESGKGPSIFCRLERRLRDRSGSKMVILHV